MGDMEALGREGGPNFHVYCIFMSFEWFETKMSSVG